MKHAIFTGLLILTGYFVSAQLNSSNINVPASSQPVPNATVTEKSATPQPQILAPASNPIPPIYSGAEVHAAETQRQIIFPGAASIGTQPMQKEPLSPIESTNNLNPIRPQREQASRENPAVGVQRNTIKSKTILSISAQVRGSANTTTNVYTNTRISRSGVKTDNSLTSSNAEKKAVKKKVVLKNKPLKN